MRCLPWLIHGYCCVVNQGLGAAALVFGRFWRRARCSTKEIQNYPISNTGFTKEQRCEMILEKKVRFRVE